MLIDIFDMDNCLSNDEWRFALIPSASDSCLAGLSGAAWADKYWDAYHERATEDQPCNMDRIVRPYVVCTARPERYRAMTADWLKRHAPTQPLAIYLRPEGNAQPSPLLKLAMARRVEKEIGGVRNAYDDRHDVIAMYIRHGFNGIRLNIHETY